MAINKQLKLPKFPIGVGDGFADQAKAQLKACVDAGIDVVPVWNKSNREHLIMVRATPDAGCADAVKDLGWVKPYFLDADHINEKTVERFIQPCDFFTLDVADLIGKSRKASGCNGVC